MGWDNPHLWDRELKMFVQARDEDGRTALKEVNQNSQRDQTRTDPLVGPLEGSVGTRLPVGILMKTTMCPSRSVLQQFLSGLLSETDARRIEEHFASCTTCLKVSETLRLDDSLASAMPSLAGTEENIEPLPTAA